MPRQITQLPNLFGFLVSQLGLIQLVGKLFQRSKERLFRVVLAMVASGSLAQAASSVTLEWDPSPHTDVVGYIVFSGIVGTSYLSPLDVGGQTSATLTNLFGGITNFFFVRAYNTHGLESAPSDVMLTNFPGTYPPPTISPVPDQLIGKNTSAGPIPVTIGDALFTGASLRLSGTSSNPTLVPNDNISFGGAGSNRTVIVLPALDQEGSAIITLTVSDEIKSVSTSFRVTVDPAVPSTLVYLPLEAESAVLVSPMAASADLNVSGGQYVSTADFWSGRATFGVDIPVSGGYVIWRRMFALDRSVWSFDVFVDDIASHDFDEVLPTGKNSWQWAAINGPFGFEVPDSDGSSTNQTVFPLNVGQHSISFGGLDPDVRLDEILITNDRKFIPLVLTVPANRRTNELATLVVTNTATVSDRPATSLSFSLTAAPNGVILDPITGVLSWTPTEAQGPSTNVIGVQVTDNGSPPLTDEGSFTVIVDEVNNSAPVLTVPADLRIDELSTLVVTNTFVDSDLPPRTPTFSLVSAPEGMFLNPVTGVLVWTPAEAQGPSTNLVTVQVPDNGSPPRSDSRSFIVVVNELNHAPVLTVPPNKALHGLATLVVTNVVTDPDVPANTQTFSLLSAPNGVSLDPSSGVLTWTPSEAQRSTTNLIVVSVTDNGSPPLSDTGSFTVVVNEENSPPVLTVPANQTINELSTFVVTNRAVDPDIPVNTTTFSLASAPAGMTLDSNTGVLRWTPTEIQGPSTNLITVRVTDNGSPPLSVSDSFTVVVNEANRAPVLTVPANQTINELTTLVLTNTATDADLPTNTLTFRLLSAPAGMNLDSQSGVLTWTPAETEGLSTNLVIVQVTDNGSPPLSATNSFTVIVQEVNSAPVLTVPPNKAIHGLATLVVTNIATDADVPADTLTFELVSAPEGVSLDPSSGVLTWTPIEAQRSSTNLITIRVTDNGSPPLSDTGSFTVVVNEENSAPLLTVPANQTLNELSTLVVTNAAIDPDIPVNALTFGLVSAPAGMTLDSDTGVLVWTPTETQGPSTNLITVQVTDNGSPPLSATNSFTVVVNEVNSAPVLTVPANQTITELSTLIVTNTATDPDLPVNLLNFNLLSAPAGMTLNHTTGVLTWTPTETQGPSTNLITVQVTDNGSPRLSATNSFTVVVTELNSAPGLTVPLNQTMNELSTLVVTNFATDADFPANTLTFSLVAAPAGVDLDATTGVLRWTPTEAHYTRNLSDLPPRGKQEPRS